MTASDRPRGQESAAAGAAANAGWDDAQLVRQVVERESRAHFDLLISRYQDKVFRLAASVLGPTLSGHAEDAAQQAFARAFTRLASFRGESSFATWLYRLSYNAAVDLRRKLRRHTAREVRAIGDFRAAGDAPSDRHARDQEDRRVRAAVARLPESYRTIVHLYYWQELTVADIAEILGSNPGTVKSYLFRARQRLARLLQSDR